MSREKLSVLQCNLEVIGVDMEIENGFGKRYAILKSVRTSDILFCVNVDDMFDSNGNRFEDDIE